jgi:hypothetical protein
MSSRPNRAGGVPDDVRRIAVILVRTVFQGKFGKGGELAKAMSAGNEEFAEMMEKVIGARRKWRVLSDLSGSFDTVVFEVEAADMAEWFKARDAMFAAPEFGESMADTVDMIEGGRNEYWTIEAEGQ